MPTRTPEVKSGEPARPPLTPEKIAELKRQGTRTEGCAPEVLAFLADLPPVPPPPPAPAPAYVPGTVDEAEAVRRAVAYLARMDFSVQGSNGSAPLMAAARAMCWGFALGERVGCQVLAEHFNPRCSPPWPEWELQRACGNAMRDAETPFGHLLAAELPGRGGPTPGAGQRASKVAAMLADEIARVQAPAATVTTLDSAAPSPLGPPLPDESAPPPPRWVRTVSHTRTSAALVANCRNGQDPDRPTTANAEAPVPIPTRTIAADLLRLTGGWPKACGGRLFVPGEDGDVWWLDDATDLFGWVAGEVGHSDGSVNWSKRDRMTTKAEFLRDLRRRRCERYNDVLTAPHVPEMRDAYYLHPALAAGDTGAFDRLLSFFRPATEVDAVLLRAFFLTLAWGGKPGGRPMFVVEAAEHPSHPGQGTGKSTLVQLAADLFGGFIGLDMGDDDNGEIQRRLLSEEGRAARLVVFDNVKSSRFSSSLIESYVTARFISGRQMFVGEGKRSNTLTWCVTANQPSFSRDFASRIMPLRLARPEYTLDWDDRVSRFVTDWRWQILADICAILRSPVPPGDAPVEAWGRWASWQANVLARAGDPSLVAPAMAERRSGLDDDAHTADAIIEALRTFIGKNKSNTPDAIKIRLPTPMLCEALRGVSPHKDNHIATPRWLATQHIPGIRKVRTEKRRYWLWVGPDAGDAPEREWDDVPA